MYAIIKDSIQVYTFDEKPKFQRGVLAYPLKAFDILDGVVEVIEFEDTAKPEPTTQLKEVFRDGIVNGLQVWNERNKFDIVEEEAEYLAKLQSDAIAQKIAEGQKYVESTLKEVLENFNKKYGRDFESINGMGTYATDVNILIASTQCDTLIKWKNLFWDTARANQASVLAGTMTDAEFLACTSSCTSSLELKV
jgi:hypothetical protein